MNRSIARNLVYRGLSIAYAYPDDRVYASMAAGEWIRGVKEALHLLDEKIFEDYLKVIEEVISGRKRGEEMAMIREYNRLFVDGFPYPIVPPYGSFYLQKEGWVPTQTISELLRLYKEAGFGFKEELLGFPDHIAHELEFMGTLAAQEAQASGGEKIKLEEVQMNFLSRFILPWVPTFCEKITEHSQNPFYHSLADLTKEFINFEKNYLGVPEEPNSWKGNESATAPR